MTHIFMGRTLPSKPSASSALAVGPPGLDHSWLALCRSIYKAIKCDQFFAAERLILDIHNVLVAEATREPICSGGHS
jgi:hypothetical protein